jgi:hypothetical protein
MHSSIKIPSYFTIRNGRLGRSFNITFKQFVEMEQVKFIEVTLSKPNTSGRTFSESLQVSVT